VVPLNVRKTLIVIPIMVILANIAILIDIPLFRGIIVFIFLSFVPGFAIFRLFRLKEFGFLDTIIFSVALSIAFVMFMGLLVNEFALFIGFSQALTTVPLTAAISTSTLVVFFIGYRHDFSEPLKLQTSFEGKLKDFLPLSIVLLLLPLISAIGVLYLNIFVILFVDAIIAVLCIMSTVSRRMIPEGFFPFLIFSISIALACQVLLTSKYIIGWDANIEYYVFTLTSRINGNWAFLDATLNSMRTLTYNSMLSITVLPAVYSVLMHAQGELVFKVLYPFVFLLVPLAIYRICEEQFGKRIGLLSTLFFIFTYQAFSGPEPLGLNRQIVGEIFLILSIFVLVSKTIPVDERRWLLIIFGAALVVSHYTLAYLYLILVAIVFIISRVKPKFDDTLNTVTVLLLSVMTLSWYAIGPSSALVSVSSATRLAFTELFEGRLPTGGTVYTMYAIPEVFTAASWINLLLSAAANLFLVIGVITIIRAPKEKGIFEKYRVMSIASAIILFVSLVVPSIASSLNFTRFYGITALILSPCFILGGQILLARIGKAWIRIKRLSRLQLALKSKNVDWALFLIAIFACAYFFSEVGVVNRVTNGAIHSYNTDFDRMLASDSALVKTSLLYSVYIPEQDVFSATWLLDHRVETARVFASLESGSHAVFSYGLVPDTLQSLIATTMTPTRGSFIYLGSLNIVNGAVDNSTGFFDTSQISFLLDKEDLVYSNGNSEVWYVPGN
jgi:uncharacterized membrane protein